MNRIFQSESQSIPSTQILTMWSIGDKAQKLGLTNPTINPNNSRHSKVPLMQQSQFYSESKTCCKCTKTDTMQTKPNSESFWNLLASSFVVYAQEKQTLDKQTLTSENKTSEEKLNVANIVSDTEVQAHIAHQTGMERLQLLFGSYEELVGVREHPSMSEYKKQASIIFLATFALQTYGSSMRASDRFKSRAVVLKYDTKFLARRAHMDAMMFAGIKGGLRMSFKIGITVSLMLGISRLISTYRNKSGLIDVIAGAGLGFGLVCLRTGPKAFLGGTILGSVFGVIPAAVLLVLKKEFNMTQEEEHFNFMRDLLRRERMLEQQALEETYTVGTVDKMDNEVDKSTVETSESMKSQT